MSKVLTSLGASFFLGYSNDTFTTPITETFRKIPKVVDNSDFDFSPETINSSSLSNLNCSSSVPNGYDTSGVQHLKVLATEFRDAEQVWEEMIDLRYSGKQIWLCIEIPKMNIIYIPIIPIEIFSMSLKLNDKVTRTLYYSIAGDICFAKSGRRNWGEDTWFPLALFNNNQTLDEVIELSLINYLFQNVFYMGKEINNAPME